METAATQPGDNHNRYFLYLGRGDSKQVKFEIEYDSELRKVSVWLHLVDKFSTFLEFLNDLEEGSILTIETVDFYFKKTFEEIEYKGFENVTHKASAHLVMSFILF